MFCLINWKQISALAFSSLSLIMRREGAENEENQKLDYRAFFVATEKRKKFVGNEAVFHPTTDKEVMKFKMQKAQIHSSANESASPDSTLIALALIYLETWKKFTACCPTQNTAKRENQFGFAIISTGKAVPPRKNRALVYSPFY